MEIRGRTPGPRLPVDPYVQLVEMHRERGSRVAFRMADVPAADRVPVERQRGRDADLLAPEPRFPSGRVPVVTERLDAAEHGTGDPADAFGLEAPREPGEVRGRDRRVARPLQPEVAADHAVREARGAGGRGDPVVRSERVEDGHR